MKKLMIIILLLFMILFTVSCASIKGSGTQWDTTNKTLFTTYTALNTIDVLQTRYIFESDKYIEANPVLKPFGKNGATAFLIGTNVGLYYMIDYVEPKIRKPILTLLNIIKIGIVGHNHYIGVNLAF